MRASRVATVVLGVGVVICVLGVPRRLGDPAPYLIEAVLLPVGAALMLVAARRALGLGASATKELRIAVVLLSLFIVGQLARVKSAFPFLPYTMYGRLQEGTVSAYELRARHSSGRQSLFLPGDTLTSLRYGRISRGVEKRLLEAEKLGQGSAAARKLTELVERTLTVLIDLHNAAPSSDPIACVNVVRLSLPPPYALESANERLALVVGDAPRCARWRS